MNERSYRRAGILKYVLASALTLTLSSAPSRAFETKGLGFTAPQIKGTSNVYNPQVGDIVYDYNVAQFFGYDSNGSWQPMSTSGTTTPAGMVIAFAGSTTPVGYFLCDGSAVSRTTFSALFTALSTTYGSGDGSTTFNLPNMQGLFVRGAGSQTISGVAYSGGTLGAKQQDQFQGHTFASPMTDLNNSVWGRSSLSATGGVFNGNASSTALKDSGPITDGTNGTPRAGTETRPANISLRYLIKY